MGTRVAPAPEGPVGNQLWHSRPRLCSPSAFPQGAAEGRCATTSRLTRPSVRTVYASGCLLVALLSIVSCHREAPEAVEPVVTAQLKSMRDGLSAYAKKHGRYPASLEELVASGILKEIPTDPVTKSKTTWRVVREESVAVNEFSTDVTAAPENAPIVDVRSGASGADSRGVPWSEY